jgi:hypothetical protein
MARFDDWMNDLTDEDSLWGPLLFLRPDPDARFTPQRIFAFAVIQGLFWGMVANLFFGALARAHGLRPAPVAVLPLVYLLLLHGLLSLTLVPAWNRRAAHLARRAELRGRRIGSSIAPTPLDD